MDSVFEGVLLHDNQKKREANASLSRILGYNRQELISKKALDLIHPDQKEVSERKLSIEEVLPFETRTLNKDGTSVDIEIRAKNFNYNGRIVRLVTIQEISNRKRIEEEKIATLTMKENVRVRDDRAGSSKEYSD